MRYRITGVYDTDTTAGYTAADTTALADHLGAGAIITAGPGTALTIELTVDADSVGGAFGLGLFDASNALRALDHALGLANRAHRLVSVTVSEEDWHTAQIVQAGMPGVVTISQAAPILDVSQQRASQLAADDPNFPATINPGREPRLYDEQAMRDYAATRTRGKGGRPKSTTS